MSLITRCPACLTTFRVVPDQLRISQGWVRCGQCDEVFDAATHMQEATPAAEEVVPGDLPAVAAPSTADALEVLNQTVIEAAPEAATQTVTPIASTPPTIHAAAVSNDQLMNGHDADESALHTQRSSDETIVSQAFFQELEKEGTRSQARAEAETPNPSFMQGRRSSSSSSKPWVRVCLSIGAFLLSLSLGLQVLTHERDRIASSAPEIRPVLAAWCEVLACTLAPLRQIESVVMDSSSFSKLRDDVYRLNFTLKNSSQTDLAVPAIELSLMDVQDQPLMRRVIFPLEIGFRADTLAAVSESSASLTLAVKTQGRSERIAGYRVLAFYP